MPLKQEVADQLTGHWQIGLFETPVKAPVSFLYGCCCSCCMAAQQRLDILKVIGEPYICCGGLFPCGPLGDQQDPNCVWVEACCCTGLAISANRFLIQTRFDRENTPCDDCLIWSVCLASWAVCILDMVGVDVPEGIDNMVDCAVMAVNGCMLAQQKTEVDFVEKNGLGAPNPQLAGSLPPTQQQMMGHHGKPMGMGAGMAVGAVVGGAAGGAAMGSMMGGGKHHGQAHAPGPQVMGVRGGGGFMSTLSPSNISWAQQCQSEQPTIDPSTGYVVGNWGACLAYAKMFEHQDPSWENNPEFESGPCGQVIEAMVSASPPNRRKEVENAANRLEDACEGARARGMPYPVINQM